VTDLAPTLPALSALLQVILIDVALSGDNAIVIALAAAGLPAAQRRKAITIGIGAAIALRVVFAVSAVFLLKVPGLLFIGGLMLGWVCVRMWRDLRSESADAARHVEHKAKTLREAVLQITLADVSMSLDNVLAVSGAARDHIFVMAAGLVMAIVMMAFAANAIAPLLQRWRWLSYAGLALIAFVATRMIVEGLDLTHMLHALSRG
jgi:YjbE family integral membrane protein